jgi:hypothetical protein
MFLMVKKRNEKDKIKKKAKQRNGGFGLLTILAFHRPAGGN